MGGAGARRDAPVRGGGSAWAAAAAARAFVGRRPELAPCFLAGPAAGLHRQRARSEAHYPSRLDAALLHAHAGTIVALIDPGTVIDLGPGTSRRLRAFAAHLSGRRAVLCDGLSGRLVEAVRQLSGCIPGADLLGQLGVLPGPEALTGARRAPRLVLAGAVGLDGGDPGAIGRLLRGLRPVLEPRDGVLLSVDRGGAPERLLEACADREGVAEGVHRAGLAWMARLGGGSVDLEAFRLEARWISVARAVELRLVPAGPCAIILPAFKIHGVIARPLRIGRVASWTRAGLRYTAALAGYRLAAWFDEPEGLRALALLQPCGAGGS